ncbi:hypothetical protein L6R50_24690 [Myxococcota bacterium]|nr:hypothetical protein [Myxococcota bacterium]
MVAAPFLLPGVVLRTAALRRWGENPTRLAQRLERQGLIRRLGHGFVYVPKKTRFGDAPPTDDALLHALLDGTPYVVTGPVRWNALGLGSTALHVHPLVYNTRRSGEVHLGGRTFVLRRVAFPKDVTAEWFVVDLLEHSASVGLDRDDLARNLSGALGLGRFDPERLLQMADRFGSRATAKLIHRMVRGGGA